MKILTKMKLVNAVIALVIIAVVSMGVNELLATLRMKNINDSMSDMYKNNLIPIARIGAMRGSFLSIRLEVSKAALSYSSTYDDSIKKELVNINNYIKEYEGTKLSDIEEQGIKDFKTYLEEYIKIWDKVKINLAKNESFDPSDKRAFDTAGDKIATVLLSLKDYNEKEADEVNTEADRVFHKSLNTLGVVFAGVTLLYVLISTFIIRVIVKSSKEVVHALKAVSDGDLTVVVNSEGNNEFALMKKALSTTLQNIRIMMEHIKQDSLQVESRAEALSSISEEMSSGTNNISAAIQEVTSGINTQAEDMISISTTLNDFGNKIEEITLSIEEVDSKAIKIEELAKESSVKMNELTQSVNNVGYSSKDFAEKIKTLGSSVSKINEITNLINGIADQTNLLALNASIESARAGEAGRGFAVVAEEIRKLAEQSKASSNNIAQILNNITRETQVMVDTSDNMVSEVNEQIDVLNSTKEAFNHIIDSVGDIIPTIQGVAAFTLEINKDKDNIIEKVEATSLIAKEVSSSSEEISASTEELNSSSEEVAETALNLMEMTKDMLDAVNKFKL
jgi:methyl-accepting chemotaxis protein